jgi:hypothetical protein
VEVGFDPDRLHLFDGETGEAVYHSASERVEASEAVPAE